MRTRIPLPTARRAVPRAAVVLPLPGPVLMRMRPFLESVMETDTDYRFRVEQAHLRAFAGHARSASQCVLLDGRDHGEIMESRLPDRGRANSERYNCVDSEVNSVGKFADITETVGNTPVVKINRLAPSHVNLYVKVEA